MNYTDTVFNMTLYSDENFMVVTNNFEWRKRFDWII